MQIDVCGWVACALSGSTLPWPHQADLKGVPFGSVYSDWAVAADPGSWVALSFSSAGDSIGLIEPRCPDSTDTSDFAFCCSRCLLRYLKDNWIPILAP